ncbi:methylated-DNA--[protein]-cysteine S-methyltransferase [Virgibacillus sp. W0430]|uniref:methylated-DNA--[protein]-cysteine S-methyltransferase n=1 Tax=Virgibacillus sp. W0430 TaxID=3391580 RepID=UPI003F46CC0D
MGKQSIYWTSYLHKKTNWEIYLAATDFGLCYVSLPNEPFEAFTSWINRRFKNYKLIKTEEKFATNIKEVNNYLNGERLHFSWQLDLNGTAFQQSVWNALLNIPYGQTVSYSEIAIQIGNSKAVRAVGTAIGANPLPIIVPCHRVVGKDGSLTGYRGGLNVKKALLAIEGVM